MDIAELIDKLQAIKAVEGQEALDVFVVDYDHFYPLEHVIAEDQKDDPDDPPDEATSPGTKGVFLIWL